MKLNSVNVVAAGTAPNEAKASQGQFDISWSSLAKILGALGAVGGVLLHLMGYVAHRSYMAEWGLDPGLFSKQMDEIAVLGYASIIDRSVSVFSLLADNQGTIASVWVLLSLYIYAVWWMEESPRQAGARQWFGRLPRRWADLVKSAIGSGFVLAIFPAGLSLVLLVLVVPMAIGQGFGRSAAQSEYSRFNKGCERSVTGSRCFEVLKDGRRVAHGFLIDSSSSHIALFDVDKKRARIILREGTELLADERPEAGRPAPSERRPENG